MDYIDFTVNKTSLYEQIADALEQAIIRSSSRSEKLPSEQELSKRFNVSRTVTREALKVLKERGLIQSRNGEGSFITKPGRITVSNAINRLVCMNNISDYELYETRIILESESVRMAAVNVEEEEIKHLESTITEMMAEDPLPTEKRIFLDSDYHVTLAKASGNKLLWIFVDVMTALLHEYMIKGLPRPCDLQNTIKQHQKVLDALKEKDADKAETAIREHLKTSWENIELYKREYGEQGN
jgi:GntR family transcriptional repressor for pyruvate dehydrogenase complex